MKDVNLYRGSCKGLFQALYRSEQHFWLVLLGYSNQWGFKIPIPGPIYSINQSINPYLQIQSSPVQSLPFFSSSKSSLMSFKQTKLNFPSFWDVTYVCCLLYMCSEHMQRYRWSCLAYPATDTMEPWKPSLEEDEAMKAMRPWGHETVDKWKYFDQTFQLSSRHQTRHGTILRLNLISKRSKFHLFTFTWLHDAEKRLVETTMAVLSLL